MIDFMIHTNLVQSLAYYYEIQNQELGIRNQDLEIKN
jgi:hypothetical protein